MKENKGITLVALVVTIIILLILASVTLGIVLSNNGIFNMAKKATESYQIASEREYLEQNVLSVQLDKYLQNVSSEKLGKTLYDRNLENGSIWDIIVEKENNKSYGTGWNYLGKGTALQDYGETQYNWVVNYETGEIIQLEDESYNNFDYKSTIAVDNPLFNLDSANIGLDKTSWGNNATLYYYDNTQYGTVEARQKAYEEQKGKNVAKENSGYDRQQSDKIEEYIDEETGAFNFNGNNYIEIYNEGGFDFSNGMTFEFYGKITGNSAATINNDSTCGLFGFWDGKFDYQCDTRLNYTIKDKMLYYRLLDPAVIPNHDNMEWGEWSMPNYPWNQQKNIGDILNKNIYFTVTIKNEGDNRIAQSIYLYIDENKQEYNGWLNHEYYNKFIDVAKKINYIELGRCTNTNPENWCYLQGICYSLRIYNKTLSKDEVQANYDISTAFHKYVIDSKK